MDVVEVALRQDWRIAGRDPDDAPGRFVAELDQRRANVQAAKNWKPQSLRQWQAARRREIANQQAWAETPEGQRVIEGQRAARERADENRQYVEQMLDWTPAPAAPIACERAREHRPSARRSHSKSSARGDDPPQPGEDPSDRSPQRFGRVEGSGTDTDLNLVWREALDRFETVEEFRTLGNLALIRARWMRGGAA